LTYLTDSNLLKVLISELLLISSLISFIVSIIFPNVESVSELTKLSIKNPGVLTGADSSPLISVPFISETCLFIAYATAFFRNLSYKEMPSLGSKT